ncbi:MAG: transcription-repair coupling factor [Chloroflexota bacterium]
MNRAIENILDLSSFKLILNSIRNSEAISSLGLIRATRLPVAVALHRALARPIIYIASRTNNALTAFDEFSMWSNRITPRYFPEPSALFYERADWGINTRIERISTLFDLSISELSISNDSPSPPFIISPIRAIMTRTLPKQQFRQAIFRVQRGSANDPVKMASQLVGNSYEAASAVVSPGQFARRGGIIDVWPPSEQLPSRIDFFGDEVDSIRHFDPSTQRSIKEIPHLSVSPALELLTSDRLNKGDGDEDLHEFFIPGVYGKATNIIDYLPKDAIVVVEDWEEIEQIANEIEEQSIGFRNQAIEADEIPADFPTPYISYSEIRDMLGPIQTIELGPIGGISASKLANSFRPGMRFAGQLKPLMKHLHKVSDEGGEISVVSRQAARLQELWQESLFDESFVSTPSFIERTLSEGWILSSEEGKHHEIISDGEIFGWRRSEPRKRTHHAAEPPEGDIPEFGENQLVVHVDHGIGRFKGLVERSVEGNKSEYICVEYADSDQLYVPVHQADRLSAYIGGSRHSPSISRLGGVEWKHVKSKVKTAVRDVAEDLLSLYANRKIAQGFNFNKDTVWQQELEASFPYEETDDQIRVINEVKTDMEDSRPMDRLICGDVGYGKTEVAIRAAFKAVQDGKQVAMLVPTTILAQQHFRTFKERLSVFPVEVEMLSRFRTHGEQAEIVSQLNNGTLDIVIGTHRLVQADIIFKDLGLVIIDEEQRFGVAHKEYLKKLRSQVDVLTMTATPIPRTLYLALTGVRDISTINTAPAERLPITTHSGSYSPKIVRQAILREIERGGQVFFVHNRVQTILAMRNRISKLVPEAKIAVAHGQMVEKELAEKMQSFTAGDYDVLMSTSIIESGLDIPNANTLIVDRADTFGLAQLYQLRGRVGRGAQRGYAYFFRHRNRPPTEEGKMRLETIAENSQLGAGYSIAMRDLEIRGTGDILGTRQHGHISSVGFNLYTRLLNQAVQHLKDTGELPKDSAYSAMSIYHPMINVDLPMTINIPEGYVPEKNTRLKLYNRLANIHEIRELAKVEEEFTDRFGTPPDEVENLFYQLRLKILAEVVGLSSISVENNQIVLRFPQTQNNSKSRNYPPLADNIRTSKNAIWMKLEDDSSWRTDLVRMMESLRDYEQREVELAH